MRKKIILLSIISALFILNSCSIFIKSAKTNTKSNVDTTLTIEPFEPDSLSNSFVDSLSEDYSLIDTFTNVDIIVLDSTPVEMSTIAPDKDTLSLVQQILNDTTAFAKVFKNKYGKNDNIYANTMMLKGSALLEQLDKLTKINFYNKYTFETNRDKLNKYGYSINEKPEFSDSVYELRIAMLDIQTPIDLIYNEHVKGFINVYANKNRKQTARMLGIKEIYFPLFEEILDKYNMPLELKYLAVVESALNPTAGSRAGAKGLWQFMYSTGKRYGLKVNSMVDDRFDPYKATEAAVLHLRDLYKIYHNWELALAAYNSGPGNVNRAIRRAGGVKDYWAIWPFLPRETRGYVPAFIAVNYIFNYNIEHNIYPVNPGILADGIDSVSVRDVLSFDQISEFMGIDKDDISFLNPSYKHGIIPATNDNNYILRLPREKVGYYLDHEKELYNFKSSKGIEKEKLLVQIKKAKERTIHIVRSGQVLGQIAKQYRTSVRKLKDWNGLRSSRIYPGQKLVVFMGNDSSFKSKSTKKSKTNSKGQYHIVRSGEVLGQIAQNYGMTVKQLKRLNRLHNNRIKPGQKLLVQNTTKRRKSKKIASEPYLFGKYRYHIIRSGDTLWDLARKYDASVSQIKKWNKITNSYRLKLGEKIIVGEQG